MISYKWLIVTLMVRQKTSEMYIDYIGIRTEMNEYSLSAKAKVNMGLQYYARKNPCVWKAK